ncbi:PHOSPHATASE putative-RELATED [Salix koriyanagi]|uniref:PHOSPHATASE putative-RELATED n=1 Tax=Salix koriyanagi TaxID=2511006 RepID=A0A9Q0W8G3_9ROSI|nr:PHOSPHATASE putative-RELATED [Salix koriyanagi]
MISLGGKFERVSYLPARRGIGDRSVKDYEAFESRRHVLDEILEALKDNDVNLVGVYGMAGVGKTTIVKKVAEQVKANRIFDVVVLAVVSKTPDLKTIQGEIADGLGFKFEAETIRGRAERLRERLERETKVLVILDDIWERLELDDVGIPSGSDYRGCKILMTSRDRNALYRMDTKKLFHLQVLVENEAWNLFKNMAGDAIKNPDLKPVAVKVAKRCAGLPIYLVTVASALKDRDLSEWKDALERLKRDHHVFALSPGSVLREWPAKDMLEQYSAISLPNCKISGLPEVLNCPKMQSFILYNVDPSLKIPDCLFEGTKTLQLMDMTRVQLPTLPSSLQFLEKLQTLCLGGCGLGDIALIGELKMLKVLSLIGSNIDRLPREIRQLTRLQLLDLTDNPTLEIIPPNVLSCLTQLEDLYMENSFLQWGVEGLDSPRNNASLAELKNLPFLSTLYLHITDPMILPKDFFSKKLERFNILIGEGWEWSSKRETSTIMKLKISASIQSEEGIQLLLKRTEDLHLDGLEGVKSVSYELDGQGFPSLKHLHIQNSLEIRYIVDSTMLSPIVDFPFLVSLSLDNLNKLEKICNGQPVAESFSKLRILKVKSCPMLKNLFSLHMQRGFLQLEEINIIDCEIMEVIVAEESGGEADEDEAIKLTQLRTLTLEYLPQFTSVSSKSNAASISQTRPEPLITDVRSNEIASDTGLQTPMTLFNKKIEFPNLEDLKLSSIEVEKIRQDQPGELSYWFVRLTSLIVEGCKNLKYLFTTSMVESLAQLKRLELCDCVRMEEIIIKNGLGEEENVRGMMLPKLQFLKLKGLPNLTRFCTGHLIQCCFLQQLWIEDCPALKTFISNSLSTDAVANNQFEETNSTLFDEKVAFSNIEELRILGMDNLNMIWHTEFHSDSFCKLKVLRVKQGNKLLNIFPPNMLRRFQNLELLEVGDCASLEEVFDLRSLMNEKESHVVTAFKLKNMYVWNLQKLKKVWNTNPHGILSFQNLHLVNAWNCPSLKSLFPASVALGLPQLEELKLDSCGLEEIVAEEERLGEAPKFVFPKTSSFTLWDLPKLKSFYPGRHTSEWPVLKKLDVYLCDEVPV